MAYNGGFAPIRTKYKGYEFASATEARTAVMFDMAGYDWEYEQEGYALPSGAWYLPDFFIRNCAVYLPMKSANGGRYGLSMWRIPVYVEVKYESFDQDEDALKAAWHKLCELSMHTGSTCAMMLGDPHSNKIIYAFGEYSGAMCWVYDRQVKPRLMVIPATKDGSDLLINDQIADLIVEHSDGINGLTEVIRQGRFGRRRYDNNRPPMSPTDPNQLRLF